MTNSDRLSEFVEACKCALMPSGSLLIPTHSWEHFWKINPYLQENGFKNPGSVGDQRDLWRFDGMKYQWREKGKRDREREGGGGTV